MKVVIKVVLKHTMEGNSLLMEGFDSVFEVRYETDLKVVE